MLYSLDRTSHTAGTIQIMNNNKIIIIKKQISQKGTLQEFALWLGDRQSHSKWSMQEVTLVCVQIVESLPSRFAVILTLE